MLRGYLLRSRSPRYSLLFALPLLVLYEGLQAALSGDAVAGVRNGADVLLKSLFVGLGGRDGLVVFGLLLLGGGAVAVWHDLRRSGERLEPRLFALMLAESAAYAAVLGVVVGWLTGFLLHLPRAMAVVQGWEVGGGGAGAVAGADGAGTEAGLGLGAQLVVSLGAGIYEELLFRVLLVGALLWVGRRWLRLAEWGAATLAVVLAALIFSLFHYVGPLGDAFTLSSFTFRAIAGVAFSALYVARGFGITAWTHALYDLGLSLALAT